MDRRIDTTNWAHILRDKIIENQGFPIMELELSRLISDDPDNGLILGLDGKLFVPQGTIPYVLYLARKDNNAVLVREKPKENQQVIDRIWRSVTWGEWSEVAVLKLDESLYRDTNVVLGDLFTAKLWISSDMAIPDTQLKLTITDMNDGVELAIATTTVDLNNINTILTPATFVNKFLISRNISLNQIQITLSVMVLTSAVQFGVVTNIPSQISFATIFSTS